MSPCNRRIMYILDEYIEYIIAPLKVKNNIVVISNK